MYISPQELCDCWVKDRNYWWYSGQNETHLGKLRAKWDPSGPFVWKVGKGALELGEKNSIMGFTCGALLTIMVGRDWQSLENRGCMHLSPAAELHKLKNYMHLSPAAELHKLSSKNWFSFNWQLNIKFSLSAQHFSGRVLVVKSSYAALLCTGHYWIHGHVPML